MMFRVISALLLITLLATCFGKPEMLRKQGYITGIMGKWQLGYDKKFNSVHQGFDVFYGYRSGNIDFHTHYEE